jgi:hypothetical protein
MDYLQIIGLILMAPLAVIVITANMVKTESRRLRKMRERADQKNRRRA